MGSLGGMVGCGDSGCGDDGVGSLSGGIMFGDTGHGDSGYGDTGVGSLSVDIKWGHWGGVIECRHWLWGHRCRDSEWGC